MAKIKIEKIIEHMDLQFRRSLDEAVKAVIPGTEVDTKLLYREFKKALLKSCRVWETVPDASVDNM